MANDNAALLKRTLEMLDKKYERFEIPKGAVKLVLAAHISSPVEARDFKDEMIEAGMRGGSFQFVKSVSGLDLAYKQGVPDAEYDELEHELWNIHYKAPTDIDDEYIDWCEERRVRGRNSLNLGRRLTGDCGGEQVDPDGRGRGYHRQPRALDHEGSLS